MNEKIVSLVRRAKFKNIELTTLVLVFDARYFGVLWRKSRIDPWFWVPSLSVSQLNYAKRISRLVANQTSQQSCNDTSSSKSLQSKAAQNISDCRGSNQAIRGVAMTRFFQFVILSAFLCCAIVNGFSQTRHVARTQRSLSMLADFQPGDADILVRAFRGEDVERTPVWLMRQVSYFVPMWQTESMMSRYHSSQPRESLTLQTLELYTFSINNLSEGIDRRSLFIAQISEQL